VSDIIEADQPPFVATFLLPTGPMQFVVANRVAREDVGRFALAPDSPLLPAIIEHLDDRAILLEGLLRYYGFLVRGGTGLFYMDDAERRAWAIPARNVLGLAVEDPTEDPPSGESPAERRIGFSFNRAGWATEEE
jgi:hypothetical protein